VVQEFIQIKIPDTVERTNTEVNLAFLWDRLDEKFGKYSDHANLFSDQQDHKDVILFKTRNKQIIKGIEKLSEEEQLECQQSFKGLESEIREFINELEKNPKARKNGILANQLRSALSTPKNQLKYVQSSIDPNTNKIINRPVLVFWGFREIETNQSFDQRGISDRLTDPHLLDPPKEEPPFPDKEIKTLPILSRVWWSVPSQRKAWYTLLWIIITGLICWIIWLLLISCSVSLFKEHESCLKDRANISSDIRNQNLLENHIKGLERELLLLQHNCQIVTPQVNVIDPSSHLEIKKRLDNSNARSGEVNVTLSWDNLADLDLHLVCPNGQVINFTRMKKNENNCGELDVDANHPRYTAINKPIEHIFIDKAQVGHYKTIVKNLSTSNFKDVKFKLLIDILGKKEILTNENTVKHKKLSHYVYKFQVKKD